MTACLNYTWDVLTIKPRPGGKKIAFDEVNVLCLYALCTWLLVFYYLNVFHSLSYCSRCLVSALIVLLSRTVIIVHLKECYNRNKMGDVARDCLSRVNIVRTAWKGLAKWNSEIIFSRETKVRNLRKYEQQVLIRAPHHAYRERFKYIWSFPSSLRCNCYDT